MTASLWLPVCLSVCLSTQNNLATAGMICMKLYTGGLTKLYWKNSSLVQIRRNMRLCRQGLGVFVVMSHWNCPKMKFQVECSRLKVYNACPIHFSDNALFKKRLWKIWQSQTCLRSWDTIWWKDDLIHVSGNQDRRTYSNNI